MKKSELILCTVMQWLRYKKQIHDFSIEFPMFFNAWIADLVCWEFKNGKRLLWEIEIKTSKSDFLNDFKKKKSKHGRLSEKPSSVLGKVGVNKFFFAIPLDADWKDFAEAYLKENYPYYGLLGCDIRTKGAYGQYQDHTMTYKRAKLIDKEKTNIDIQNNCAVRLSLRMLRNYHNEKSS